MPNTARTESADMIELGNLARQTIINVMVENKDAGTPGRWKDLKVSDLIVHAKWHVQDALTAIYGWREAANPKLELSNALTRIAMALHKLEAENDS